MSNKKEEELMMLTEDASLSFISEEMSSEATCRGTDVYIDENGNVVKKKKKKELI